MGEKVIYFYTCLGPNCKDYAEFLRKTCEATKSGGHDIRYCAVESVGCDGVPDGWEYSGVGEDYGHSSKNHASAINTAVFHFQQVRNTGDVFILCDADMVILERGWDLHCNLRSRECFGVSNGDSRSRYVDFPTVYFMATTAAWAFDFVPDICGESPKRITREEAVSRYCGAEQFVGANKTIKCDTGWLMPRGSWSLDAVTALPRIWSRDPAAKLPFKNDAMRARCLAKKEHQCEWHHNGQLFASHKQACRSHSLHGSQEGRDWYWRVNEWMNSEGLI
jgi:hypothetical protein